MFREARIKLTVWYLAIIMVISLSFSGVIYLGVNQELNRIENFQKVRIQRIIGQIPDSFPEPPILPQQDIDAIAEARHSLILTLGAINLAILFLSGAAGYFLAGRTLEPIAEMMDKQKEFVSDASHELRTPLTSLMTEIEVTLRDKKLSLDQAKKLLSSNLEEVKKMNDLSNTLLRLNKFDEEAAKIEFGEVDLKAVALDAIDKVLPIAAASKINIIEKLNSSVVHGNATSLTELVIILLDNAVKYSKKGGSVEVITKKSTISITDHGMGVPGEDIPHIFDRFYRADTSRSKQNVEGYGLGLSIAKSIADLHGARIKVVSRVGKGSTFTVIF